MTHRRSVGIRPELPEFRSWNWLGLWIIGALGETFDVTTFQEHRHHPDADVVILLKSRLYANIVSEPQRKSGLVFVPVGIYGGAVEIDADIESLRCLSQASKNRT